MKTKKNAITIFTALCLIAIVVIVAACDTDRGMMHGNISITRDHWHWSQILISLSIGLVGGFLLGRSKAGRR
jgi:hypothetical protein